MGLWLDATLGLYKEFYGTMTEQMSALLAENGILRDISQLMRRRLQSRDCPKGIKPIWMNNDFDSGDGIIYHPNGDIKIVLNPKILSREYWTTNSIGCL